MISKKVIYGSINFLKTTYTLDTFYSSDLSNENNKKENKNFSS